MKIVNQYRFSKDTAQVNLNPINHAQTFVNLILDIKRAFEFIKWLGLTFI